MYNVYLKLDAREKEEHDDLPSVETCFGIPVGLDWVTEIELE